MSFHLVVRQDDTGIGTVVDSYLTEFSPVITQEEDGRISIGVIHFDSLQAEPQHLESIAALSDKIAELLNDNQGCAVCIMFEQSTGTPLLVVVRDEEVDPLSSMLKTGFSFLADPAEA